MLTSYPFELATNGYIDSAALLSKYPLKKWNREHRRHPWENNQQCCRKLSKKEAAGVEALKESSCLQQAWINTPNLNRI